MRISVFPAAAAGLALATIGCLPFQHAAAQGADKAAEVQNPGPAASKGQGITGNARERTYFSDDKARDLLAAIDSLLTRAAEERAELKDLPSRENYVIPPLWKETREDREQKVRQLLDSVLQIVSDAPVVEMQAKLRAHRDTIGELRDRITTLREKRLGAPEESVLPGVWSETQSSIDDNIAELQARIKRNEEAIAKIKQDIKTALAQSGIEMGDAQLDLLVDSVLGGDLIKLVTAFQAARSVDDQLAKLLSASNDDVKAARRYFAMHAALFAMMLHAQELLLEKIDTIYITKLRGILGDIRETRNTTRRLLSEQNRADQKRALQANIKAQNFAEKVASFYRDYLLTQRRQLAEARERTLRDLAIADNTFETVEASFQLRELMRDARTSFEALQRLEAPGFDQVFKNETLRKEFESLTQKLGPTS
jgi:predicted transcriptional regulator